MSDTSSSVSTRHQKLDHLCELASARGGELTTHASVARKLDCAPSRISKYFGYGPDADATPFPTGLEGDLVRVFNADGVPLEMGWLHLPLSDFKARFAPASAHRPAPIETPWTFSEATAEKRLVEFRLHEPHETNRGLALSATLLFGTIEYEEDGIALGLRQADLDIEAPSFRPAEAASTATASSPNLKRIAGGLRATGPRHGESLYGDTLDGAPLAALDRAADGPDEITVTVSAGSRSFCATALDPSAADAVDPETKDALVNAILKKALGATPRPILARANLSRLAPTLAGPPATVSNRPGSA